ncbi:23S ribosomal RNA methyltransferase [Atractiella rhizophila]|nr:23S ribosomal RNA methyltransferase [Atractiella rhizophila]
MPAPRTFHTASLSLGKSPSTSRWLARQKADPYVRMREAGPSGQGGGRYVSRSAFKLIELHEICHKQLIRPNMVVADLGAAPGGWTQVARDMVGKGGKVVGLDLLDLDPSVDLGTNATFLKGDFTSAAVRKRLEGTIFDVVLSDMLGNVSGNKIRDAENSLELCRSVLDFANRGLRPVESIEGEKTMKSLVSKGSTVVMKAYDSQEMKEFVRNELSPRFLKLKSVRLKSSRDESKEMYLIGLGMLPLQSQPISP